MHDANNDTVQYLARIVSDPILLLTAVQELRLYASQWGMPPATALIRNC